MCVGGLLAPPQVGLRGGEPLDSKSKAKMSRAMRKPLSEATWGGSTLALFIVGGDSGCSFSSGDSSLALSLPCLLLLLCSCRRRLKATHMLEASRRAPLCACPPFEQDEEGCPMEALTLVSIGEGHSRTGSSRASHILLMQGLFRVAFSRASCSLGM